MYPGGEMRYPTKGNRTWSQVIGGKVKPYLHSRYVVELKYVAQAVNSVRRDIIFAKELEINNCLHFLDGSVKKSPTSFITSTSRKPTHTGFYSIEATFVPLCRKRKLANSLLRGVCGVAHPALTNWCTRRSWMFSKSCFAPFIQQKFCTVASKANAKTCFVG